MGKNASFKGDISGTIENQVNDWDNQSISGSKSFAAAITSSADVMLSGSGKVSASFFYGDGSGLSGVGGTITSYTSHATDRLIAGGASSTAIKGLSTVTFTGGKLGVTGQISASLGVSGSEFHGDGSNLTAVTASFVTASNVVGILDASQINIGDGLEDNSDKIRVKLISNSGLSRAASGMQLDVYGLSNGSYSDASTIALGVSSGNTTKITLSALENDLNISGSNIVGDHSIPNERLQNTVSVQNVTASQHISASTFHGDGAALTGVTSTPTPAGSNTQIQFNNNGAIAADADLTFLTGSNTLATSNLSASVNISGSSLYLQDEIYVGGQAFLDIETNVAANNASFTEVTASSVISSSADVYGLNFRGNGSTLNNVPLGSSNASSVVFVDNYNNKTITTNSAFTFDGTDAINTGGGFKGTILSASANVQVGGHITGSGDIVLLGAGNSIIFDKTAGDGPSISTSGADLMVVDGDNTLQLRGDNYVTIQQNTVDKLNFNFSANKMVTAMVLSSSAAVSASIIDSLTGYKLGDQTIIDSNANLTVGSVEIVAGGSDVLNFNDNSISGSGNISGSAFYGDGSNLQNIAANNYIEFQSYYASTISSTTGVWFAWTGYQSANNFNSPFISKKYLKYDGVVKSVTLGGEYTGGGSTGPNFEVAYYKVNSSNTFVLTGEATGSYVEYGTSNYFTGSVNTAAVGSFAFSAEDIILLKITSQNETGVSDRINKPSIGVVLQYT